MRPSQYHYIKRTVTRNMHKRRRKRKKNDGCGCSGCIMFFIGIGILYAVTAIVATIVALWKVIVSIFVAFFVLVIIASLFNQAGEENARRAAMEAEEKRKEEQQIKLLEYKKKKERLKEIEINAKIRNAELDKQDREDNYEQWKNLTK